jgi:hypothetical protein
VAVLSTDPDLTTGSEVRAGGTFKLGAESMVVLQQD